MFWRNGRASGQAAKSRVAAKILNSTATKADVLAEARDNLHRMQICAEWQAKARADWYIGERAEVTRILNSADLRYRFMGPLERKVIGSRMWALNPRNKDLAGAEQMYARWVSSYYALARADGLIP